MLLTLSAPSLPPPPASLSPFLPPLSSLPSLSPLLELPPSLLMGSLSLDSVSSSLELKSSRSLFLSHSPSRFIKFLAISISFSCTFARIKSLVWY